MNKTELESVVAFVQKMNPEIMELKFGCRVRYVCSVFSVKTGVVVVEDNMKGFVYVLNNRVVEKVEWFNDGLKILGRDITLLDVISAYECGDSFYEYSINGAGYLYKRVARNKDLRDIIKCTRNAPLHLQSPELITFLFNNLPKS